jgi:hypothetical protein
MWDSHRRNTRSWFHILVWRRVVVVKSWRGPVNFMNPAPSSESAANRRDSSIRRLVVSTYTLLPPNWSNIFAEKERGLVGFCAALIPTRREETIRKQWDLSTHTSSTHFVTRNPPAPESNTTALFNQSVEPAIVHSRPLFYRSINRFDHHHMFMIKAPSSSCNK